MTAGHFQGPLPRPSPTGGSVLCVACIFMLTRVPAEHTCSSLPFWHSLSALSCRSAQEQDGISSLLRPRRPRGVSTPLTVHPACGRGDMHVSLRDGASWCCLCLCERRTPQLFRLFLSRPGPPRRVCHVPKHQAAWPLTCPGEEDASSINLFSSPAPVFSRSRFLFRRVRRGSLLLYIVVGAISTLQIPANSLISRSSPVPPSLATVHSAPLLWFWVGGLLRGF